MQQELYIALKAQLETITDLRYVGLWNNQYDHENDNVSFDYPNCFIEFTDIDYTELLQGVQKYHMHVRLHLGFESYKTEDIDILALKQAIQKKVHLFQEGYHTKMLRRGEVPNYDHDNVQEYIITYSVSGKDYSAMPETKQATVTLVTLTDPKITNHIINTGPPIQ
jgi:hypothetical protein